MKRLTASLVMGALLGTIPALADNILLDESKLTWAATQQIVSGDLFLCEGPAVNFQRGPCMTSGPSGVSDIIIFNNAKHDVTFLSNESDGTGLPADVEFGGGGNGLVNPRFVAEPNSDTLMWAPGPNDPGFYNFGNTWTIVSNDRSAVPEPSTAVYAMLMIPLVAWRLRKATRASL